MLRVTRGRALCHFFCILVYLKCILVAILFSGSLFTDMMQM